MIEATTTEAVKTTAGVANATTTFATGAAHDIQKGLSEFGRLLGLPENINFPVTAARIVRIGLSFVGIILLVLVLGAGFTWMTAGGDEEKIIKAKKTLVNAFVGLFLIFSAYSIVSGAVKILLPR